MLVDLPGKRSLDYVMLSCDNDKPLGKNAKDYNIAMGILAVTVCMLDIPK